MDFFTEQDDEKIISVLVFDLISCLEKNQFTPFPKCYMSKKSKVESANFIIETNCDCGETDGIQNMVGCEWTKGRN